MSAHDDVAVAIVRGQYAVMGKVAINLAERALGVELGADPDNLPITNADEGTIERLVAEYSRITGPLGVRMCFKAAETVLQANPDLRVPAFAALQ